VATCFYAILRDEDRFVIEIFRQFEGQAKLLLEASIRELLIYHPLYVTFLFETMDWISADTLEALGESVDQIRSMKGKVILVARQPHLCDFLKRHFVDLNVFSHIKDEGLK
jgi:hypothetical protein